MTDEELIARLRKADEYEPLGHDGWEAADLITALLAQIAALRAERDASNELGRAFEEDAGQQRERAEAAEAERDALISQHAVMMMERDAARFDVEAAEAQIAALTARVEGLTGAAKRMVAVWETPFTDASRRDAREQQDKAVDAAVSNIRAALSATTEEGHE